LRVLAKGDGGLRSDSASFPLPLAETLDVRRDDLGRPQGFARAELRLGHRLRADVSQHDQNKAQPEGHSQKEPNRFSQRHRRLI
jgi:hypothetical protein